jgi:hypothetical protein
MQYPPDTAYPDEGDTVQAVTTAVTHVAVALDELKDQLEIANRRVSEVAAAQTTEAELGRLFVRAAEFADSAIAEAQDEARQVVADAHRQADRILAIARGHADAIIEEAERSTTLPSAFALHVQAALDGFTHVNAEFMKEVEFLRDSLQPALTPAATRAEMRRPPEVGAVTVPSVTAGNEGRPAVPEVAASTPAAADANSLDSLLANAWHPAPAASPPLWPSGTQDPQEASPDQ